MRQKFSTLIYRRKKVDDDFYGNQWDPFSQQGDNQRNWVQGNN